jgi:hypothetical protein
MGSVIYHHITCKVKLPDPYYVKDSFPGCIAKGLSVVFVELVSLAKPALYFIHLPAQRLLVTLKQKSVLPFSVHLPSRT